MTEERPPDLRWRIRLLQKQRMHPYRSKFMVFAARVIMGGGTAHRLLLDMEITPPFKVELALKAFLTHRRLISIMPIILKTIIMECIRRTLQYILTTRTMVFLLHHHLTQLSRRRMRQRTVQVIVEACMIGPARILLCTAMQMQAENP